MKIADVKLEQIQKLKNVCLNYDVDYESLSILLESVRTKKLLKRNNYHQQKINEEIEKATK